LTSGACRNWHNQQALLGMATMGRRIQNRHTCDEQLKSFAHMVVTAQVGLQGEGESHKSAW
jgi:hypothetical protein